MTELSRFWDTTTGGDASDAPYDSSEMADILMALNGAEGIATYKSGVFRGVDNTLNATAGSGKVTIDTGKALVAGRYYKNTAALDIAVATPTLGRRDRIVLKRDTAAQTVRLVKLAGVDNNSGTPPAIPAGDASTWYQPLWQINITSGGVITVTTDERSYLPAHGDQSNEGGTRHTYGQIANAPQSANSTPASVGFGIAAAIGVDTGHYANDDHIHAIAPIPLAHKSAATIRSVSGVPADDPHLQITVVNGSTYLVSGRLVVTPTGGPFNLVFVISGGSGVVLGLTTLGALPIDATVGSQYFTSANGAIELAAGVTHIIDFTAIIVASSTVMNFQWNPDVTIVGGSIKLDIGSYIYALLAA